MSDWECADDLSCRPGMRLTGNNDDNNSDDINDNRNKLYGNPLTGLKTHSSDRTQNTRRVLRKTSSVFLVP